MILAERTCVVCHATFTMPASRLKHKKALYCSKSCQFQAQVGVIRPTIETPPNVACQHCQTPFYVTPSRRAEGRGLYCSKACMHIAKGTNGTPEERFWRQVDQTTTPNGCWLWIGAQTGAGYGLFNVRGKLAYAHRFAYELAHGALPPALNICHTCDTPPCCRAEHLFAGTDADNHADMRKKGRHTRGEKHEAIMRQAAARGANHGWNRHPELIPRGERVPWAKLTDAQVLEIRALEGTMTQQALADRFGMGIATINAILRRKTWTHLP